MSFIEEFFLFLFALLMMLTMNLKLSFAQDDLETSQFVEKKPPITVLLKNNNK
jgi:hypothetical protein